MSVAAPLVLREGDRSRLEALTRSSSVQAGLAQRARIVLLAAHGPSNAEIARRTSTSRPTVVGWSGRYATGGIAALEDLPRSGRPPQVDEIAVVVATLADEGRPPEHLGVTHWSAGLLAAELGVAFATAARIWRKWNLQPWRVQTFTFSTDPSWTPRSATSSDCMWIRRRRRWWSAYSSPTGPRRRCPVLTNRTSASGINVNPAAPGQGSGDLVCRRGDQLVVGLENVGLSAIEMTMNVSGPVRVDTRRVALPSRRRAVGAGRCYQPALSGREL